MAPKNKRIATINNNHRVYPVSLKGTCYEEDWNEKYEVELSQVADGKLKLDVPALPERTRGRRILPFVMYATAVGWSLSTVYSRDQMFFNPSMTHGKYLYGDGGMPQLRISWNLTEGEAQLLASLHKEAFRARS